MEAGYKRAFMTIFDSHTTTILAALVLFFMGSGTVRGFAVTLGVGTVLSLFTATTFTQYMLRLLIGANLFKSPGIYGASARAAEVNSNEKI